MSWIETYTGVKFDLLDPKPEMVNMTDIIVALSSLCRFTGHCSRFYSVAEHSVYVSMLVPPHLAWDALWHDAAEAYVGDMSHPLKQLIPQYKAIEENVWRAVSAAVDVPLILDPVVKQADVALLLAERRELMPKTGREWTLTSPLTCNIDIVGLPPEDAASLFTRRVLELSA